MGDIKNRPRILLGYTGKIKTGCGSLYITANFHDDKMFEVFALMGKSGSCFMSQINALTLAISLFLREGGDIEDMLQRFAGIQCSCPIISEGVKITSCADALAQLLKSINELHKRLEASKKAVPEVGEEKK